MNKPLDPKKTPPPILEPGRPAVYYMPTDLNRNDELNLLDLWRVLLQQKYIIASLTLLGTVMAIFSALNAVPVYRAEILLASTDQKGGGGQAAMMGQLGGFASLAGLDFGASGGSKQQALAILKSRVFTKRFIEQEGLLPWLFASQWDMENQIWLAKDSRGIPDAWHAFKVFDGLRSISEDKKSGLVRLSIEWTNPEQAAKWVNALVSRLNEDMRQQTITESEQSIAYLKRQLLKTGVVELQQSIYRLIEAQIKNIMLAKTRVEFSFKVIDPAVVPQERIRPNRKKIVLLGFMAGLVLSIFVAFAWSWIVRLREEASYERSQQPLA